tara:strand:+ start:90 stop:1082 length:993 start_codon:yes stop_codon:yes gene_type:complete
MSDTPFHQIENRSLLEECPVGIDSHEWDDFRKNYCKGESFEFLENPVQLDVELNGSCNMECPFCLHGYEKRPHSPMAVDRYKQLIDEAITFGIRGLKLNYINEPMLRKDLEQCIRYAKSAGMLNIYLSTNGSLLNPKRRLSMIESGITKVFISIDAATAETYNQQRLSGRFNQVVENVLKFIEERNQKGLRYPLVRVSFLRNKLNIHEEDDFVTFWQGKADMIGLQKMNELPDQDSGILLDASKGSESKGCTFPFKQLVIDYEGDILPCCKMGGKKLALGNIKDMSLRGAWESDEMESLKKSHAENRWHENPVCRRCLSSMGFSESTETD